MQHRALPDRPEKISVEPQQALDERQFQDQPDRAGVAARWIAPRNGSSNQFTMDLLCYSCFDHVHPA
jgi:hypothetical protein